jgi:hypothetical protein
MDGRFARLQGRLNRVATARLSDSLGSYQQVSQLPVDDLALQIDRGVDLTGAGEIFQGCTVAITVSKIQLGAVIRGGLFIVGAERFTIEHVIADDGHMITAACMVTP